MRLRHHPRHLAMTIILVALLARPSHAGPLDPPTGPVATTGRTMILELPYTISASGSYVVARNLFTVNGPGITITTGRVTLDLGGFNLSSSVGNTHAAVEVSGIQNEIVVVNGVATTWPNGVINAPQAIDCRVENITYRSLVDSPSGITLGDRGFVRGCMFAAGGLTVGKNSLIQDSVFPTIATGVNSYLARCIVPSNGVGFTTVDLSAGGSTAVDCNFGINTTSGLTLGPGSTLRGCTVDNSAALGGTPTTVTAGAGCLIDRCTLTGVTGGRVVAATGGATVRECIISGTSGAQPAILITGSGNRIDGNVIRGAHGIDATGGTNNIVIRNSASGPTSLTDAFAGTTGNTFGPRIDARAAGELAGGASTQSHPWANFLY